MKNKNFLIALPLLLLNITSVQADEYSLDVMKVFGDIKVEGEDIKLKDSYEIELKYKTDMGGYAYIQTEKGNLNYIQIEDENISNVEINLSEISFGLGVIEKWERDAFSSEIYVDAGYFKTTAESKLDGVRVANFDDTGFKFRIGANINPFPTDKIDLKLELAHNSYGKISGKDTHFWGGINYEVLDNMEVEILISDKDLIKAGFSYKF